MITEVKKIKSEYSGEISTLKMVEDDIISFVPIDPANTTYAEIMRQVDAGELTIEEAE
jgi:hypothetical protein